jgi:hypothetical protein
MRRQLEALRETRAWVDEQRGGFRERFVDLGNEVIAMELELIDEMWASFWKLYGTEVGASAANLTVSGLTGGPGGVLADAVTQIGTNFMFNEGGVAFETFDESAMRAEFHRVRQELEEGSVQNDCTLSHLRDFLQATPSSSLETSWSAGVAGNVALMDQAGLHVAKELGGNAGQLVHVSQNVLRHRTELHNLNRALRQGVRETTVGSFWGTYQLGLTQAIERETTLLAGWERKLDDFFTLRGWGGTALKGAGSFVAGILIGEVKDAAQASILEEESAAWAAFFQKELEASLTWSALMRASCTYWALVDEEAFLAGEYDAFVSSFDPSRDFRVSVDETFTDEDELVLTVPFSGAGGFRVEVTVAGVRGEARGGQRYAFPAGSFEAFEDGTELEVVVEVLVE